MEWCCRFWWYRNWNGNPTLSKISGNGSWANPKVTYGNNTSTMVNQLLFVLLLIQLLKI